MSISKKAARKLAVSYASYVAATDPESQGFWAWMLSEAQQETGVELQRYSTLQHFEDMGKKARDKRKAEELAAGEQLALAV